MKLPDTPAADDLRFLTEQLKDKEIQISTLLSENAKLKRLLKKQ